MTLCPAGLVLLLLRVDPGGLSDSVVLPCSPCFHTGLEVTLDTPKFVNYSLINL